MEIFLAALVGAAGWNAGLAGLGAAMLGAAAGWVGTYALLRRRALLADVAAHAALPGVAAGYLVMVALGGDGRALPGLLAGAAVAAAVGALAVEALGRRTRLTEDAAMAAVLSVGFGLGVVLLTVIQAAPGGRAAGLEGFLLGSVAGMLREDATSIAVAGALAVAAAAALRRPMLAAAFDPGYAAAAGIDLRRVDLAGMALVLAVTVIGLKVAGLVLIVALLVIPPAAARFWTDRAERMAPLSAAIGAGAGWVGAAASVAAPGAPTGPVIVMICFAVFVASLLGAPGRGAAAGWRRRRRLRRELRAGGAR